MSHGDTEHPDEFASGRHADGDEGCFLAELRALLDTLDYVPAPQWEIDDTARALRDANTELEKLKAQQHAHKVILEEAEITQKLAWSVMQSCSHKEPTLLVRH